MTAIGGYFELELNKGKEFHFDAMALNTGRNALELILMNKNYRKVYIPFYTCDVILEPFKKTETEYEFYKIDKNLEPDFDTASITKEDAILYTNYFGIKDKFIETLKTKVQNLIIDNSQAFYSKALSGVNCFYSARKFFGLPDGAYLYSDMVKKLDFEKDISSERFKHLLGRIDLGAEACYESFTINDNALVGQPIKLMSDLTSRLLANIDYDFVSYRRRENFLYLHNVLGSKNHLQFNLTKSTVPMVYPFLVRNGEKIKKQLIENKVYVATYWPNVKEWINELESFESYLVDNLISLPIDQRYSLKEMERMVQLIKLAK